jgi:hypothetical protein
MCLLFCSIKYSRLFLLNQYIQCTLNKKSELKSKNQYFDSTILLDEISFDFKIRQGICQNMNASFLLKKMALIDG